MLKIVLLGNGNVAFHLHKVLANLSSVKAIQWYSRTPFTMNNVSNKVQIVHEITQLEKADLYILAVSDDAINNVSKEIPFHNQLVVHTAGSKAITAIDTKHRRGVFYPLQTFSKNRKVTFTDIPLCIEAEKEKDLKFLKGLAQEISSNVLEMGIDQRKILHLSAVFVCNFVNHLFSIGAELCETNKIPFTILQPLIEETVKKIKEIEPHKAQTGPAIRNDRRTIETQLDQLNETTHKKIYQTLTESILKTYER